jgi:hypothetical protein
MGNFALCHLLQFDGQVDLALVVVPIRLCCIFCGQSTNVTIMLI